MSAHARLLVGSRSMRADKSPEEIAAAVTEGYIGMLKQAIIVQHSGWDGLARPEVDPEPPPPGSTGLLTPKQRDAFVEAGRMWRRMSGEVREHLGIPYPSQEPRLKDAADLDSGLQAMISGFAADHPDAAQSVMFTIAHQLAILISQQDNIAAAWEEFMAALNRMMTEIQADKTAQATAENGK